MGRAALGETHRAQSGIANASQSLDRLDKTDCMRLPRHGHTPPTELEHPPHLSHPRPVPVSDRPDDYVHETDLEFAKQSRL